MSKFYSVPVQSITHLTDDSVCIKFDLKSCDPRKFKFKSGQYITISHNINGEEIRRSYSISSSPENGIEIGVKLVENGRMSTFLTKELNIGDLLKIMPPTGDFSLEVDTSNFKKYVGICSGSGITPILSMITNVLISEPESSFVLIYGNKSISSTMYLNQLKEFELKYKNRFSIFNAFSRENIIGSIYGRIDASALNKLFDSNSYITDADSYFICGPGNMIESVRNFLDLFGIPKVKIRYELFSSPVEYNKTIKRITDGDIVSNVIVSVDGDDFDFKLSQNGDSILEAAIKAGADVPYSCKGGVCSVCKAKIITGSVSMDMNYSLADDDVEEGYILTCQSHPKSENLHVDYDEI
ncbi:MAG: 2Fe-2S iron-sulfur cluster binding domain-containing protein [Flavobacteriales bacterium]|jgi:ring-1,2-phenylacetyl-CoA epoxidase subunit PaaE|nr:2Fe-2S iron-sulfur cluster binding domain-containing protein [Flavobacteriales bacterium]|tara:strand:+ start:1637 stop:2698 length:1062 start_codon:yes stop_codon:yes gene_type:complete